MDELKRAVFRTIAQVELAKILAEEGLPTGEINMALLNLVADELALQFESGVAKPDLSTAFNAARDRALNIHQ